jgi:hypothetical protein
MLFHGRLVQKGSQMHGVSEEKAVGDTYMHVECIRKYKHEKLTAL